MIKTILFDLDGTLLPFKQDEFIACYFSELAKKAVEKGLDGELMINALLKGTQAMLANDGNKVNEEAFWEVFCEETKFDRVPLEPVLEDFYQNEFHLVKSVVKPTELSRKIVDTLKHKGYRLVLATMPLFPPVAVAARLSWINLSPSDFEYITTYDNSSFCKPNLCYFEEIFDKLSLAANECMMVGNNVDEDMCAEAVGVQAYLVTDCLENKSGRDYSELKQGSLEDFYKFAKELPDVN